MVLANFWLFVLVAVGFEQVAGHGMMLTPTNRASLWRYYPEAPKNYNDNQYFCGGVKAQYQQNDGKCGVCGDNYVDPRPRSNENTGKYGNGYVSQNYTSGSVIQVLAVLTANHLGEFFYSLCVLEDPTLPEPEDCFQPLLLADGRESYPVLDTDSTIYNHVKLPDGVRCERCVLRWHYKTGNSWGICEDGTQKIGCGKQEVFRSCADIAIF